MSLERSRNYLSLLRDRLPEAPDERDRLIESVVVGYLLTTVYADIELQVRSTLAQYGRHGSPDGRVGSFVTVAVTRIVRSVNCESLAGVLGMFDAHCKKHFQMQVNNTKDQAAYDRLVAARHDQAHNLGSALTLDDLEADLDGAERILIALEEALACSCLH